MSGNLETRTLLFSDIEGSTRMQAATGDAYADILATHHRLVRETMAAHNGTERSTEGDGFFVSFASAREALAAAVEAQLALRAHEWPPGVEMRVRMGLHAGEVGRPNEELVGLAINEAARIMDAAHGGQVLVSPVVRDLTVGALPAGASARSLGRYRLKDFDDPVELIQICHEELESEFPPPRTSDVVVDLPSFRTSFVGREREVADVLALLSAGRHVTLTGVGGSGKTRLALEVAALDADRHPDGVYFVDLAPLADPDLVLAAVAEGVSVGGDPSDLETMLLGFLSGRRSLLVIDNCEHLIDACADVVDLLLSRCRWVRVLATSREALQIDGEQTFSVPSLPVDDEASEAVELFVSRARAVKPDFVVSDANRDDVLAICRRLDGIPLAIELAASRVDHMSVGDIAARLDERFDLLVGGRRRRAQRQQTLQAAMDWSWTLLTDEERTLLRRLAVFAGPFTLESAEAVCGFRPALRPLASLVNKSLVGMDETESPTRYRLLETVRLYAQERLVESGEAAERRAAHRDWYLACTEALSFDELLDARTAARFVADHGNVRAALDWSSTEDRPDLLARQIVPASQAWGMAPALFDEGRRWLQAIVDDERLTDAVRADVLAAFGGMSMASGDYVAIRPSAERALALEAGDSPWRAYALMMVGRHGEAVDCARSSGTEALARMIRSWEAGFRAGGDPHGALEVLDDVASSLPAGSLAGDRFFHQIATVLARLCVDDGEGALEMARWRKELIDEFQWMGALVRYPSILEAMALGHLGRFDEARAELLEVTRVALRDRYPVFSNDCLVGLAYIVYKEGDVVGAARMLEPVLTDGRVRFGPFYAFIARLLNELLAALGETRVDPPLPSVADYLAHIPRVLRGEIPSEALVAPRIEEKLLDFVG